MYRPELAPCFRLDPAREHRFAIPIFAHRTALFEIGAPAVAEA
jgi:hypothetical protein